MKRSPLISIVIATYNSEKKLPSVLNALRQQSFTQEDIEVLVIDGGSIDATREIAKKFGASVLKNNRTEPVYAKFLGFTHARGRYLMYLDADEVLENKNSLKIKYGVLRNNPDIKMVIGTGYNNPPGYSIINEYINEFGEPFSFFIYRLSKSAKFFLAEMQRRYKVSKTTKEYVVFDFLGVRVLPIIELCAAASMIDKVYMQKIFPQTLTDSTLIPHFFYLLQEKKPLLAITKNDTLLHYSSDTLKKYLAKIKWRIKNNIYHVGQLGFAGFTGRQKYLPFREGFKKYLFVPYGFSILFPLLDSIYLSYTRKNIHYFFHVLLSFYTAFLIVWYILLKRMGINLALRSYDESIVVKTAL